MRRYSSSRHVQGPATLDLDEVLTFAVPATLARLFEMADEWGGQLMGGMLGHISDVSDEHGQTVDASGRDFGDVLLESCGAAPCVASGQIRASSPLSSDDRRPHSAHINVRGPPDLAIEKTPDLHLHL